MNIKDIIKKYIPTMEFINYGYYANIHNYYQIARINEDKKYTKNSNPSIKTFSATYHNKTYSFDYYISSDNNSNLIFIKKSDSKIKDEYTSNHHCAFLSYFNKDNLFINIMEYSDGCIKIDNKQSDDILNGSVLIKLIIKFGKTYGFKNIILDDKSYYTCGKTQDNKLTYQLKYVHTLTKGIPYYNKFGFIFNDNYNQEIMLSNQNKINSMITEDIDLDMLIYLIVKTIVEKSYQKIYDYNFIQDIYLIMQMYNKQTGKPLKDFFNYITYNHCHIMAMIYIDLFRSLGLQTYNRDEMILKL